ncbi:MAG TPA: hypothetical protein VHX88_15705 [Solirubrobacteraceae bacterium]|jgi:hypothetical protein|nr:hypothetical protein [Solirubrobacteraceae bacterium]
MAENAVNFAEGTLRMVAMAVCACVLLAFALFAVPQINGAAKGQAAEVVGGSAAARAAAKPKAHENPVKRAIDGAASTLESPFAGLVSGSSSQWARRGVETICALLIYGLGLGYIARFVRVRR